MRTTKSNGKSLVISKSPGGLALLGLPFLYKKKIPFERDFLLGEKLENYFFFALFFQAFLVAKRFLVFLERDVLFLMS